MMALRTEKSYSLPALFEKMLFSFTSFSVLLLSTAY